MRRNIPAVVAAGLCSALALTACGSGEDLVSDQNVLRVGVILPDTSSSPRWESADRPLLEEEFRRFGIQADVQNAGGDGSVFQVIADGMIATDVDALLFASVDAESGTEVIKNATASGIPVIDYDRLTVGGGAAYYVSFDNVGVGEAIGDGLVKCLDEKGVSPADGGVVELNGSPTDNNATLFKQGYDKALKAAGYRVLASSDVPDWDPIKAAALFKTIDGRYQGDYVGVVAANDNLGEAAINRLASKGQSRTIPVTGQDASDAALQRLLLGTQCVTVYKSTAKLARTAAQLTAKLISGDKAGADAFVNQTMKDPSTGAAIKAALLKPQAIQRGQVKDVVKDGGSTAQRVCTTKQLLRYCAKNGVR